MDSSSIFKPYCTYECIRGDKQSVIKNSIGRQLPYIINFKNSTCQVFDVELERITHAYTFPDGCILIDVDYFPTTDGRFGFLIGVEDSNMIWGSEHFIAALSIVPDSPTMAITGLMEIPNRITVVKTLFSNVDMKEGKENGSLGLHHRLLEWPHVIAIGCKSTKCYLTSLMKGNTPKENSTVQIPKKRMLDLLAGFVNDDIFTYSCDDGAYREYPTSGVYVSALALMPRSRTLLVGLSMGGILAASLNPSNQMELLELRHDRLIHEIAPMEPEDDPDKYEYFIAAVDRSSNHSIMIQLWRGSFIKDGVVDSEKYNGVKFHVTLEHKIRFGERWLSVKTIVSERGSSDGLVQRRRNDSSMDCSVLNTTQNFGCTSNRSNVFLAYERLAAQTSSTGLPTFVVEASIFDIDAWYYKRVPGRVVPDNSVLRQCPFMSCIRSEISSLHVNDIGILTLDSTSMSRFNSMISDADQLFYPSSMSYGLVFVAENNRISWMKIQSIQETILEKCSEKLPWIIRSPELMASHIIAAGLIRKSILTGSPNASASESIGDDQTMPMNIRVVLNAMMYYGKIEEFTGLIKKTDLSDKIKIEVADWAFFEAVDYKRIISDRTVSLFQGSTCSLSPLAEETVNQGIKLFRIVYEYIKSCSIRVADAARLRSVAHSVKCMLNHTKLVSRFINVGIVPVNHQDQQSMRQMHEQRKRSALINRTALPVQVAVRNMHRLASGAQFWNDSPHDNWYPPTPLDLLESVLNLAIPERIKREIVIQYIYDWLRANPYHSEKTDNQLALEIIKVMTNQMLEVDLEKIYFAMDQEKSVLKENAKERSSEKISDKNIFSMDEEGITYEQLWRGEAYMSATVKQTDIEKFKQRMNSQSEKDKKVPTFDPETEKFYQAFLFENQRYDLMSSEAIESHQLLSNFIPATIHKNKKTASQKSSKEREIERSVKEMFEKQQKKDEESMPEMFATVDKNGRKRRSEANEMGTSPTTFVPPTAKRIQQREPEKVQENENHEPETSAKNCTLSQMIATPARYYKRPVEPIDMASPTETQKLPILPKQNSILKTAKALQSPSRGRIRFHASVRKGINDSIEAVEDEPNDLEENPSETPKINFAIIEDDEEADTLTVRRSRSISKPNETEKVEAELFEVLDELKEQTLEAQMDEEESHASTVIREKQMDQDTVDKVSPSEIQVQNAQLQNINADIVPGEVVESVEMEYGEPEWDGIERSFEVQKDEDCELSSPLKLPSFEEDTAAVEMETDPAQDIALDRTFEVQEDEETHPLGDAELSYDSNTFVVRRDEESVVQKPSSENAEDVERPPSANTRSKVRSREVQSRSVTPVDVGNETSGTKSAEDNDQVSPEKPKTKGKSPSRSSSVTRSSSRTRTRCNTENEQKQEDETTKTLSTGRITRSRTNSRSQTPARQPDKIATSVHQPSSETTTATNGENSNNAIATPSKRGTRRTPARSSSVAPESATPNVSAKKPTRVVSAPTTPRRAGKPAVVESGSVQSATKKSATRLPVVPEETSSEEPAKRSRGRSRTATLKAIPESGEGEQAMTTPKRGRPRNNSTSSATAASSSAPTTPKRGRKPAAAVPTLEEVTEEPEQEQSNSVRRSARRLQQKP
ncbi:hypothetical protein L5515_007639 [Caenorhabditis briggsae]|uniref:Uncharacterized protein n=2 Tax=Caenorhabditis briggsae TaxID=6238 RepID=A0AAE9JKE3_CAEBR|nr:hypothetical protein L5515_007639 [Caenorhabditis briggsae]